MAISSFSRDIKISSIIIKFVEVPERVVKSSTPAMGKFKKKKKEWRSLMERLQLGSRAIVTALKISLVLPPLDL